MYKSISKRLPIGETTVESFAMVSVDPDSWELLPIVGVRFVDDKELFSERELSFQFRFLALSLKAELSWDV